MCQSNKGNPPKAPLHPWEWPSRPWSRLHIDHAGPFHGKLFLIVVDAYSKWIDVQIVPSTSAEATIAALRPIFSTFGLPQQLVSDNGTGFTSAQFQEFLSQNGVKQILTSPYHPSSNGLAERAVQTFKNSVSKLEGPMEVRLSKFLFKYRVTPHTSTGISPAELLMGRRLRTHLDLLYPDISVRMENKAEKNISGKKPRKFTIGEKVYAKNFHGSRWLPAEIIKVTGPLSYQVETEDSLVLRRHVDHLRKRFSNELEPDPNTDEELLPDGLSQSTIIPLNTAQPEVVTEEPVAPADPQDNSSQLTRHSTRIRAPIIRYSPSRYT